MKLLYLWYLLNFTSIFGYGPGFGNLELRIRIRQKLRIIADPYPDPQYWPRIYINFPAEVPRAGIAHKMPRLTSIG
jgi:hypothetical protein